MTHKELLLKDLCARLPYGVKVYYDNGQLTGNSVIEDLYRVTNKFRVEVAVIEDEYGLCGMSLDNVKPYLFPMSSMTEEQKRELRQMDAFVNTFGQICFSTYDDYGHELIPTFEDAIRIEKWLNKNHFDYRGLIEKGLAIDATGLNIY